MNDKRGHYGQARRAIIVMTPTGSMEDQNE
jgi:hypothetical protein